MTKDNINHPDHYTAGSIECIEAIKAQMTHEEFIGYLRGNIVKYLWRYRHKGGIESIRKAQWYLNRLEFELVGVKSGIVIPINNGGDMKVYKGKPDSNRKLAHQMPRKTVKKSAFKCIGGPYDGVTLFLTDGVTAVFTVDGNKGRYNNGEWQKC